MTRFIFICSALVVVFAGAALGAGNYQHTKDGKIIVWNDDPQPGDAAVWFGDRDKENYATGVGTLTWYQGAGAVYARYHGNMVHGKFDGAVNVHSKRKTGHATFANGKRTSRWLPGSAASRAAPDGRLTAKSAAENAERPTSNAQRSRAERRTTEQPAPEAQATEDKTRPEKRIVAKKEPTENPRTEKQDIPAEGPAAEKKSATADPSISGSEDRGQPPSLGSGAHRESEDRDQRAAITTTSAVGKKDTPPVNGSVDRATESKPEIRDLLAPPSALREDPIVETPSTAEPQRATSPSANAQLTAEEALNLADIEARAQGYDLDQYQRTNADYSNVKKKWSLSYDLKQADAAGEKAPHFRVSVDDETRKVEIQQ